LEIIEKYFDEFSPKQTEQINALLEIYTDWNAKINVISRKDMDNFYLKHVLHSLAIPTVFNFTDGQRVLDIGTGGGFPGIPLAIFFPEVEFILADSIKKKLSVVNEAVSALKLKNVKTHWGRVEEIGQKNSFDFAVSRAVAPLSDLWRWSSPLIRKGHNEEFSNGLICLKGGDLHDEISTSGCKPMMWHIYDMFREDVFMQKFMLYVKR
jgi:16S rRNA (guanine527-N7)-methyltransferase